VIPAIAFFIKGNIGAVAITKGSLKNQSSLSASRYPWSSHSNKTS
jgi:hypothetical protein